MSATSYPYNLLSSPEVVIDTAVAVAVTFNGNGKNINVWAGSQAPYKGLISIINTTVAGGTPTLTAQLQLQDPTSSQWVNVPGAVTTSITTVTQTLLYVYPGTIETANVRISFSLPSRIRFVYTIGGAGPSYNFTNTLILVP